MEPVERVLRDVEDPRLIERLATLPGTDFTTVLLEAMRQRARSATPSSVMRQRRDDRFVAPSPVDLRAQHETERLLLSRLPGEFESVLLAPLAPMGLHAAVARVDQNRLVATARRTDVAADPTAGLALEAAMRRRMTAERHDGEPVELATLQRVTRAQTFEGAMSWAHFTIFGLVTAGRSRAGHRFEIESLARHATVLAACLLATGPDQVTVTMTDWSGGQLGEVATLVADALPDDRVSVREDPNRTRAHGYYGMGAFEIGVRFGELSFSAADGGLVDWTAQLLHDARERTVISGIGVDRVTLARSSG